MGFYSMVDQNLTKAFKAMKDIALTATFVKKPNTSFDFGRAVTKSTTAETVEAKVVIIYSTKESKDRNVQQMQIMFKVADVGDLVLYETVTIDDIVWKIGRYVKTDRFINIIELFREG